MNTDINIEKESFIFTCWNILNMNRYLLLMILLLTVLRNPSLKYYCSDVIVMLMFSITCVTSIPILILRPKNPSNFILTYPFARLTSKVLGLRLELRGGEILANEQAAVVAVNHQSMLDLLVHCSIMNVVKSTVLVSRREIIYILPYSLYITLCGSIFINRSNGKEATESLLKNCPLLLKHKAKLLIYPEGKLLLNSDALGPFKKGAFRVAIKGQIPIIPYVISPFYFIDPKRKSFTDGHAIIKVLEPISTVGLTMNDVDSLTEKTWKIMNDEYQKLREEIYGSLNGKESLKEITGKL